ncbi:LysR family transcriptional regulator [Actinoplanes sp. NBRC 14428]|nr:LysR family transcriptional regulator [Actinoplanes sp. NBRC 14428]
MAEVDLRQLRYLVAVADEGAFTAAADLLVMTQPALSRAVAALERAVGATLLDRTPRGVELTAAGKVLVDEARDILRQVDLGVARTRRVGDAAPPVRISARGCDLVFLHGLVRGYGDRHPGEGCEPVETDWHRQIGELRAGEVQVALFGGEFEADGLDSEVLAVQERVALVPASHRLAHRTVVDRAELLPDPVVNWSGHSAAERAYWLGAKGVEGEVVAGPQVNDVLKLMAHLRLGTAIAFVPLVHVEHVGLPPDIAVLRVDGLAPCRLRLVWPEHETSPAVARFVRFAADRSALVRSA